MPSPRPLIAGNWKMNGLPEDLAELDALASDLRSFSGPAEVAVCPPFPLLALAAERLAGSGIQVGAQDCHAQDHGAHTGCTSARLIAAIGARFVIVGHSERRADNGETNEQVLAKAQAAARAGLRPIVCVGETLAERDAGQAQAVVQSQVLASVPETAIQGLVVAYEPVWAIGTGHTPTLAQIEEVHACVRSALASRIGAASAAAVPVLYGGSVKPDNAAEILALDGVDGALVGGASLKAASFAAIVRAQPRAD